MRDNRDRGVALTVVPRFARWRNLSSVKRMFDCASFFTNCLQISIMRKEEIINVLSLEVGDWVLIGPVWVEVQCLRGVRSALYGLMVEITGHGCFMQVSVRDSVKVLRHV